MAQYSIPYEGGCRCGAIRYKCSAEPIASYHCYCRDCQRESGTAFGSRISINTPDFSLLSGEPKWYGTGPDDGERVHRYFCEACGSGIYSVNTEIDIVFISVGSLDDPSVFQPTMSFWVSSAQPWVTVNENLTNFDTQPTLEELAELLASDE